MLTEVGAERLRDYEAYTLIRVPKNEAESISQALRSIHWQVEIRDEWDLIYTPGSTIDTRSTVPLVEPSPTAQHFFLLKFLGPLLPEWHTAVREADLRIVGYFPHHTLLVFGTTEAFQRVRSLPTIEWSSIYGPEFRATVAPSPELGAYTIAFADVPQADSAIARLRTLGRGIETLKHSPGLQLWEADLTGTEAASWIADPFVLFVERRGTWVNSGEAESLSLSSYGMGNAPAYGGNYYRQWLAGYNVLDTQAYTVAVADYGFSNGQGQPIHADFPSDSYPIPKVRWKSYVSGELVYGQDEDGHGTAVAGMAVGDPNAGMMNGFWMGLGVAPKARLYAQRIFGTSGAPQGTIYRWLRDAKVDGQATVMNLSRNEYAVGLHGFYTTQDQAADRAVRHENLPVTASAGNIYPNRTPFTDSGFRVLSPAVAKNVITVGAVDSFRSLPCIRPEATTGQPNEWNSGTGYYRVSYLGRRGVMDGRYKPDILAPAGNITSAYSPRVDPSQRVWCWDDGSRHLSSSGTSFAAPQAAGALVLVNKKRGVTAPMSAALAKATLIGLAQSMKDKDHAYPTYQPYSVAARPDANGQGWGKLMLADYISGGIKGVFVESVPYTGGSQWNQDFRYSGDAYPARQSPSYSVCNPYAPVHIVLAWNDYPATAPTMGTTLVNDLMLRVQMNTCATGDAYQGNRFNGSSETSLNMCGLGSPGVDYSNNVEVVTMPANTAQSVSFAIDAIQINGLGQPSCTDAQALEGQCDKYMNQSFAVFISNASQSPCY